MEVLVIGAGAAGLAAAQNLSNAGVAVRILEARSRVGGRIETVRDRDLQIPVELGAEFVHGRPSEVFEIAHDAGFGMTEMAANHRRLQNGSLLERRGLFSGVDEIFERMSDPDLPDQSFAEFIDGQDEDEEAKASATAFVEGFDAARADRISTRALAQETRASHAIEGDRSFRIAKGYNCLAQWLLERCLSQGVTLSLSSVVSSLRWRQGCVEATLESATGNAVFRADRAIVTVPLGVLKAPEEARGAIRFDPPVVTLREVLTHLEMGAAVRITFLFRPGFVKEHRQLFQPGFIHSTDQGFPTWWTGLSGGRFGSAPTPTLTAWAGGSKAERLAGLDDEALAGTAIDSLSRILSASRDSIAGRVKRWYVHNWCRDPFARGAYSYAAVGGVEARRAMAVPIEQTLYFAGEAVETEGQAATVHGAIASGRRAARQILDTRPR